MVTVRFTNKEEIEYPSIYMPLLLLPGLHCDRRTRVESHTSQGDLHDTINTCLSGCTAKQEGCTHAANQRKVNRQSHAKGRLHYIPTSPYPKSNICKNTKFPHCWVLKVAEFYTSKYKIIQKYSEFQILHAKSIDIPILQGTLDMSLALNYSLSSYIPFV